VALVLAGAEVEAAGVVLWWIRPTAARATRAAAMTEPIVIAATRKPDRP
jgi:hypothetical protein